VHIRHTGKAVIHLKCILVFNQYTASVGLPTSPATITLSVVNNATLNVYLNGVQVAGNTNAGFTPPATVTIWECLEWGNPHYVTLTGVNTTMAEIPTPTPTPTTKSTTAQAVSSGWASSLQLLLLLPLAIAGMATIAIMTGSEIDIVKVYGICARAVRPDSRSRHGLAVVPCDNVTRRTRMRQDALSTINPGDYTPISHFSFKCDTNIMFISVGLS